MDGWMIGRTRREKGRREKGERERDGGKGSYTLYLRGFVEGSDRVGLTALGIGNRE